MIPPRARRLPLAWAITVFWACGLFALDAWSSESGASELGSSDFDVSWSRDEVRWAEPVTVQVSARNPTRQTLRGGITLSFSSEVLVLDQTPGARVYFKGSRIYGAGHRRTLRSRDVMVESWFETWLPRAGRSTSVTFFPLRSGLLQVRARAAFIRSLAPLDVVALPSRSSCLDQQSYPAHCRFVQVHESPGALASLREALGDRLAADPNLFEHLQRLLLQPTDRRALAFFGVELDARKRDFVERYYPQLKEALRDPGRRDHPRLLRHLLRLVKNPLDGEALAFLGFMAPTEEPEDPEEVFIRESKGYVADLQGGPTLLSLIAAEGDLRFAYSRNPQVIVIEHWHRTFHFRRDPEVVVRITETILERIKPETRFMYEKEDVSGYSYLDVLRILRGE